MPARLTNPNAQAASPGLNPTSTRYFVWCICTAYQSKSPQKYPTMIHQKRSVRMARASVQSTATQAASTTFAVPLPAVASREERSPSGSSPRSSGRRFSRRLRGANSASTRMPIAQQAGGGAQDRRDEKAEGECAGRHAPLPAELVEDRREEQREGGACVDAHAHGDEGDGHDDPAVEEGRTQGDPKRACRSCRRKVHGNQVIDELLELSKMLR